MALQLPREFEQYMAARLGPDYHAFVQSLEKPQPVSVRYNPRKLTGYPGKKVPWSQYGRYLEERPAFTLDPLLHAGGYYVQEASSMLLEQAVICATDVSKPLNVLDLCAAPGGKSTHLLSLLPEESLLVCNEVIRSRASVLSENILKWGYDNVMVTSSDPSDFQRLPEFFDLILVDAPCSGEGLFRKEPEAAKEWSPKNVELCSLRQRRIVNDVWSSLKLGGTMIYSTCTYNDKEDMENLLWLASQHDVEFVRLPVLNEWGIEVLETEKCIGYQCYPHQLQGEGFFLAVLRKTGEGNPPKIRTKDILQYPTRSQLQEFSHWIACPETQCFFIHNHQIRMFPAGKTMDMLLALHVLKTVSIGTAVAEIMKNKLVPDHALALSINLKKENVNRISVTREQAIAYLRKDPLDLTVGQPGFALIEFEGTGLGWVNVLQTRINNLYPSTWRIRMGERKEESGNQ